MSGRADPEKQQLLPGRGDRPGPDGQNKGDFFELCSRDPSTVDYPPSLDGKVPPDRFYDTVRRLTEVYGPPYRWTKVFVLTLILFVIGLIMPFAMLRWFTPRHFPVKVWVPIDAILFFVNLGLGALLYYRNVRLRNEMARMVKKENKRYYLAHGIRLRFEPGGVLMNPCVYIEQTEQRNTGRQDYGTAAHQPQPRNVPHPGPKIPSAAPPSSSRLPSPPPFRQQHSFYEIQREQATPSAEEGRYQPQPQLGEFRSPPLSPRYQQQQPTSARYDQYGPPQQQAGYRSPPHQYPSQQRPSSPPYDQYGPPPPSNYAPQQAPPYDPRYAAQPSGPPGMRGAPYNPEYTSQPTRDAPSQRQLYDATENVWSPTAERRQARGPPGPAFPQPRMPQHKPPGP